MYEINVALKYNFLESSVDVVITLLKDGVNRVLIRTIPCISMTVDPYTYDDFIIPKNKLARAMGEVFYEVSGDGDFDSANNIVKDVNKALEVLKIKILK